MLKSNIQTTKQATSYISATSRILKRWPEPLGSVWVLDPAYPQAISLSEYKVGLGAFTCRDLLLQRQKPPDLLSCFSNQGSSLQFLCYTKDS